MKFPARLPGALRRVMSALAMTLCLSQAWAASTSLEIFGILFDGDGNRINAPFVSVTQNIYSSATGDTLLAGLGTENVHVGDGYFLQIFGLDDGIFTGDAYLQTSINGFEMGPRLGIFYNGSYYFASGTTMGGPASGNIFALYAGLDAPLPVPEPASYAMLMAGLVFVGGLVRRRRQG